MSVSIVAHTLSLFVFTQSKIFRRDARNRDTFSLAILVNTKCPMQLKDKSVFNSLGVNCSGRGAKIKAQPPLHKKCKGEGKSYTIS